MIHKIQEGQRLPNGIWFKYGRYSKTFTYRYLADLGPDGLAENSLWVTVPTSNDGWWFTLGFKWNQFITWYRYRSWTHNLSHWETKNAVHEEWKTGL